MAVHIKYSSKSVIETRISLPSSKSISNRALIIKAIGNLDSKIDNLSTALDTVTLNNIIQANTADINTREGGTTLRFLLAYYCLVGKQIRITASDKLISRPINDLIKVLEELGAKFDFQGEPNKLPLAILSGKLNGGEINISGETSSQFISALMMIGPYLNGGLVIKVEGDPISWPYVLMTSKVMQHYGITPQIENKVITIPIGTYQNNDLIVESDWSAAAHWYEIAAILDDCTIELSGLSQDSWQGDSVILKLMQSLGVHSEFNSDGVILSKVKDFKLPDYFKADFIGCPDLGLAISALCGALNITADLENLKNFRLKESDRAVAMQRGLYDLNVKTDFCGGSKFKVYAGAGVQQTKRIIQVFNDHRVAMSFAPLAIKTGEIHLDHPEVVHKSYPNFFKDLKSVGFEITESES